MNWNTELIERKYIVEHFLDHLQVTKVRAKIYSEQNNYTTQYALLLIAMTDNFMLSLWK